MNCMATDEGFTFHIHQFMPECDGDELEHRIALLKARDYAGMIRCKPIGEIARSHAVDAQEAANHFFHDAGASVQYLNFADLRAKIGGRSRAAIYVDMDAGRFPRPLKLGGRCYWPEEVVDAHLAAMWQEASSNG